MKLKRLPIAALAAALCLGTGLAEPAEVWAGFFDYYYHAAKDCAVAGTVALVDAQAATEQGKFPCPVCVDDARTYPGVEATVRGGTLVIRVPDAWMAERPAGETEDNPDSSGSVDYAGRAAEVALAERLHGADYRAALRREDGRLPVARVPDIAPQDGGLMMNRRHLGGAWYLTYRPGEAARRALEKEKALKLPLRFTVDTLTWRDGALSVFDGGLWRDDAFALKPNASRNQVSLGLRCEQGDGGEIRLEVYDDMDARICVIHQSPADPGTLAGATLLIDGVDGGIRLAGYANDGVGVFCGVLTEAEARALETYGAAELIATDAQAAIEASFATAFSED